MGDCQSFSSKPKWMERECQSLMCLMARRDIEIENHLGTYALQTGKWKGKLCQTYLLPNSSLKANGLIVRF